MEALVQFIKIECLEENYVTAESYLKKLKKENPTLTESATLRTQSNKINKWRKSQDNPMALISEVKSILEEPIDTPQVIVLADQELKLLEEELIFALEKQHTVKPIFDTQHKLAVLEAASAEPKEIEVVENVESQEQKAQAVEKEKSIPSAPLTAGNCLEKTNEISSQGGL